jgi:hypothetical protein
LEKNKQTDKNNELINENIELNKQISNLINDINSIKEKENKE